MQKFCRIKAKFVEIKYFYTQTHNIKCNSNFGKNLFKPFYWSVSFKPSKYILHCLLYNIFIFICAFISLCHSHFFTFYVKINEMESVKMHQFRSWKYLYLCNKVKWLQQLLLITKISFFPWFKHCKQINA